MPSKTSYFNKTLFLKNSTRFWPIWAVYLALWTLLMPLSIFQQKISQMRYGGGGQEAMGALQNSVDNLLTLTAPGVWISAFFGILAAMAVFSYLYNNRSAGFMHTLPIRREGLFLTNWLSGYCFFLIPNAVVALLTVAAEAFAGAMNLWNILMWFLIQSGTALFFYSFAVFCAMFTGHVLALPAFYGILNVLAVALSAIADTLLTFFILGYSASSLPPLVEWLTPVMQMSTNLYYRDVVENGVELRLFTGFQYVLVYMVVAVVLTVAALLLYRVRHMETAGDVIAVPWAKPLFKYGFALCAALAGGIFLFAMFQGMFSSTWLPLTAFVLLCGLLGCFVAEMFLQKSFKVFRKSWKSGGIFALVMLVFMTGLKTDLLGLGSWVPSPGEVENVSFRSPDLPPYDSAGEFIYASDEEFASQITAIHQTFVDHRVTIQSYENDRSYRGPWDYYYFEYNLKDGSYERRYYNIPHLPDETWDDDIRTQALALVNDHSHLMNSYFPFADQGGQAVQAVLDVYNTTTRSYEEQTLTATEAKVLADALLADVEAGRLGRHYASDEDQERLDNCSYTDLYLSWFYTDEQGNDHTTDSTITPQFTATETLRVLRELGVLDDTHILRSVGEVRAEDTAYADTHTRP